VQDFHRQLFNDSADWLRQEIKRITGVNVREAKAEIETTTGTVVQVFITGTVVQVFLLAGGISAVAWNGIAMEACIEAKVCLLQKQHRGYDAEQVAAWQAHA
jgi:hypothetical protein